ncbi:hypothetical protein D3C78_966370 [compost metagenome]
MAAILKQNLLPVIAIMLYLASLLLPALHTEFIYHYGGDPLIEKNNPIYGWHILLIGWAGILDWTISWYANPAFFASIILYINNHPESLPLSKAALALGISSFLYRNMWSEDGTPEHIASYGPAFYLWLLSFVLMLYATTKKFK